MDFTCVVAADVMQPSQLVTQQLYACRNRGWGDSLSVAHDPEQAGIHAGMAAKSGSV